jgi:hypothetical protein
MVTQDGQPVECFLTPGGFGDVEALQYYAYELPDGSIIFADKAYNDYEIEDLLKKLSIFSFFPYARRTRKELCHLISLVSRVIIVKELRQRGA